MGGKRKQPASGGMVEEAEAEVKKAPEQKLAPATFSLGGISFTLSVDDPGDISALNPKGVRLSFGKGKSVFGQGFGENMLLLPSKNLSEFNELVAEIDHFYARPTKNGAYVVGIVYNNKRELTISVEASQNGNGVVFEYKDGTKKAYFFGDVSSQLSDFIKITGYMENFMVEFKESNRTLSVMSLNTPDESNTSGHKTMSLEAIPSIPIYLELTDAYLSFANMPSDYRQDPPYAQITIMPDDRMKKRVSR